MLTIGANDLSFGDIAIACFTDDDCSAKGSDSHRAADVGLMFLPGRYAQLAQALKEAATGDEALKPEEVLITGYPDPLRDDEGKICGTPRRRGDGRPSTQIKITRSNLITQKEAKWASKTIRSLNTAVREAARLHNWTFVDGITDAFSGHGYCATRDRWIMQYEESKTKQGDVEGTLHPNAEGHRKGYAPFLTAALEWLLDPERQEPR